MQHYLPEPECSGCGAKNSETFENNSAIGRRCLNCGHEIITKDKINLKRDQHVWNSDNTRPQF